MQFLLRLMNNPVKKQILLFLSLYFGTIQITSAKPIIDFSQTDQQRALYLDAKKAFKNKKYQNYQKIKKQLSDYPLLPYLEYGEVRKKLVKLPYKEIDQFLSQNPKSYLADRLLTQWLSHLAAIKYWKTYKRYYQPHLKSTSLKCLYIISQMRTGDEFPVNFARSLWLSGKSQPDACDPVFATLKKKGHITPELLWQRHKLAMETRNYRVARYLRSKMSGKVEKLASLYAQVHNNPSQIKVIKTFNSDPEKVADIVYHGLYRNAHKRPVKTLKLLKQYQQSYTFNNERLNKLKDRIAIKLIQKDETDIAIQLIKTLPEQERVKSVEYLLRELLTNRQWDKINYWINQLPAELAQSDRWQYWKARSLEALSSFLNTNQEPVDFTTIYESLAQKRSFYGFLSADKLQQQYHYEDKPAEVKLDTIDTVKTSASLQRARELFLLEKMHLARSEWSYGIKGFSQDELIAAGQLSHLWGWHRKSIESMTGAKYWDDLSIRFPVVHEETIIRNAKSRNISSSLIFAIARQESAWEFDARSHVGARGLMQIMPATAKETARKARIAYSKRKLLDPAYNITLGSHYISRLLKRYKNNRPLAIAAYNAGPHRVKQWLKNSQSQLPADVWIEIVPFAETRKYIQNVLSYELIYNYRRGQQQQLLTLTEINSPL